MAKAAHTNSRVFSTYLSTYLHTFSFSFSFSLPLGITLALRARSLSPSLSASLIVRLILSINIPNLYIRTYNPSLYVCLYAYKPICKSKFIQALNTRLCACIFAKKKIRVPTFSSFLLGSFFSLFLFLIIFLFQQ